MADEARARRLMTAVMTAVAEPDLWPDALDQVASFFGGVGALVEFHSASGDLVRLGPRGNFFEQRHLDLYLEHYAATCPRALVMKARGALAVQSEEMIGSEAMLDRHPYYVDFLGSHGLRYHLALRLRGTRDELSVLAVQRLRVDGNPSDDEVAWMNELAPFLRAAFRARALFGDAAPGAEGLLSALAGLDMPLAFLRRDGRLLFRNDAAAAILAGGPLVDWRRLLDAWRRIAAFTEDTATIVVPAPSGAWSARILDLGGAFDARTMDGGIYVALLTATPPGDETTVKALRGVTAAEAEVLKLLILGSTPIDIARIQGVSIATVRTHIAHLHDKYGVRRTLDVVRIALAEGFGRS